MASQVMSSSFSSSFSSRGGLGLSSVGGLGVARAGSVYGGAGGKGVRISSSSSSGRFGSLSVGFGSGGGGGGGGGGAGFGAFSMEAGGDFSAVTVSEKQAMQNLNDRLARYLERVRTLEEANAKLEAQIKEWGLTHNKISTPDLGAHHAAIDDLRAKILAAGAVIGNLSIQIDNAKLAAEDFKIKYESEFGLRQSVEADIAGLRKILGEISLVRSDLELQMEGLLEEMAYLKKNHTEETISFKTQLGGQVQVEVDAAPATDLNAVISEIRAQYESLVLKNQRDAEAWFNAKAEGLQQEVKSHSEVLQTSSVELKSGTTTYRDLEIQLQAMLSLKASLEGSLAETEIRYSSILQNLQATVTSLEAQLAQIRGDTERQSMDYRSLLDIKARLEMEIAEYKRLLEGGGDVLPMQSTSVSSVTRVSSVPKRETTVKSYITSTVESSVSHLPPAKTVVEKSYATSSSTRSSAYEMSSSSSLTRETSGLGYSTTILETSAPVAISCIEPAKETSEISQTVVETSAPVVISCVETITETSEIIQPVIESSVTDVVSASQVVEEASDLSQSSSVVVESSVESSSQVIEEAASISYSTSSNIEDGVIAECGSQSIEEALETSFEASSVIEGSVTEDQVSSSTITTTVTMVEEVVDGEVVSTSTKTEEVEVVG